MATTQQEIPIGDDELDALMAELETETAGMVAAPAPVVAAAPEPAVEDDDLAALDAELEVAAATPAPTPVVAPKPAPKPAPEPEPAPEPAPNDTDAEMAALEAELLGTTAPEPVKPAKSAAPAPKPAPKPEPAPEPEPAPKPVLKAVPTPDPEDAPEPAPNPIPKAPPAALQFYIDVAQFRDDTKVSDHNLDKCMMEQASLRAYYSEQAARAEAQHARLKLRAEIQEAALFKAHRAKLIDDGEKPTEKLIEASLKCDPRYKANEAQVIEAQTIANINRGLVESLKERKDMLVQLGADRREEGKGQLRVMAAGQAHDDLKARALAAASRSA